MPRAPRVGTRSLPIVIRRAEPEDAAAFARIFSEKSVYSGTLQVPMPSLESWRKRLAEPTEGDYILVACVGGEVIGNAGLHAMRHARRAHAMNLGLTVREDHQGKGVGKALLAALLELADGWLNVTRLELTVFTDNARAIALYRKSGFVVEGTHKGYALRAGRYADVHFMARIRAKKTP